MGDDKICDIERSDVETNPRSTDRSDPVPSTADDKQAEGAGNDEIYGRYATKFFPQWLRRTWWFQRLAFAYEKTLWYTLPLIIVMEIGISLPLLEAIEPRSIPHLVGFCANCNIDADYDIKLFSQSQLTCVTDGVLEALSGMYISYIVNYLSTMVGHILIVYTLMQGLDLSLSSADKLGRMKVAHLLAYSILLADVLTELIGLQVLGDNLTDESTIRISDYSKCDSTYITEQSNDKALFFKNSQLIMALHIIVAFLCIYIPCKANKDIRHHKHEYDDKISNK